MKKIQRIYDDEKQPTLNNSDKMYFEIEAPNSEFSDENQYYSFFKVNQFQIVHCLSGFYFGYQYTILNNLGKPILKSGLNVIDTYEIDEWLGNFNMAFGMGKVIGSLLGGTLAKIIGKLNVLFLAELWNILSVLLLFQPSTYTFMLSRAVAGLCSGFNTTNAPRQILENYPTKERGLPPSIYSLFICLGLCFSFSTGKIFGEKLNDYWFILMVFPSILLLLRAILLYSTCRYESPIHYQVKSEETEDFVKKENQLSKRDYLLNIFYKKNSEIMLEKDRLQTITNELNHKKTEKSLKDLIYKNLINPEQRYAALACILFNFYPPFAGQAYSDVYTTRIFDKLVYDGFGYELTFYSGFAALAGGISIIFCINHVGRVPIIVWSHFGHFVCMYLLALSFYFEWQWFALDVNLFYTFLLYFGTVGITFVFMNEISEPFTVGVAVAVNWIAKSIVNLALPYIYNGLPLFWTPLIMAICGMVLWILIRPLYLESKDKTYVEISKEYSEFKYNIQKF